MVRFQKVTRNFFLTLHGQNVHRQQQNCPSFSCATSSSLLMLNAGQRGQFPRWRRSRKRLPVCSVLRCPDLWLQCSVSFVHGLEKTHHAWYDGRSEKKLWRKDDTTVFVFFLRILCSAMWSWIIYFSKHSHTPKLNYTFVTNSMILKLISLIRSECKACTEKELKGFRWRHLKCHHNANFYIQRMSCLNASCHNLFNMFSMHGRIWSGRTEFSN